MADAIISVLVEKIKNKINLVTGAEEEVAKLSKELETIRNVLDDADKREVKEKTVKDWLNKLEQVSYEIDDVLDEWCYAIRKLQVEGESGDGVVAPPKKKVCSLIPSSRLCFKKVAVRYEIANKIRTVKAQLDEILEEKKRYSFEISQPTNDRSSEPQRVQSTSFIDLKEVCGREFDKAILLRKLLADDDSLEALGIDVLSVVGGGGLGKTTLAQLVYNDKQVEESFELKIWKCVSEPFDVVGITKSIIEDVKKESCQNTNDFQILLQQLKDCISNKKFFLVLDDVWSEDYSKWEPLKHSLSYGRAGSKILVTTRKRNVAKVMGTIENDIYDLSKLSDKDCWLILSRIALSERNENELKDLQNIGEAIAKRCNGLPLAAKTLGSLLRFKKSFEEWDNILKSEIWQLENAQVELFPHLSLSYNELSPTHKRCFSYCAIFPKDTEINVEKLIRRWMALGYLVSDNGRDVDMELKGSDIFQNLAMRSLFQDFREDDLGQVRSCKMHDIVHDFAQFLRKNGMKETTCEACNSSLGSSAKIFRSLLYSSRDQDHSHICDCLKCLRVLQASPRQNNLPSILQGMEKLIHLRWLDLSFTDLSEGDLRTIFKLYNLQSLFLESCSLHEIPGEIANLIHLRHLDLGCNSFPALPDSICGLLELRTLNVEHCENLSTLPEGIHSLKNLEYFANFCSVNQFPQGLAQLSGLRGLGEFGGGSGWSNLGLLKNLNLLGGQLWLDISIAGDLKEVIEGAREAELWRKTRIGGLSLVFDMYGEESSATMDLADALKPHQNLRMLSIHHYEASKLPGWIGLLNHLRFLELISFNHLSSLPPLGKLPCLERISICDMHALQLVGREFLGITRRGDMDDIESSSSSSSSSSLTAAPCTVSFPKLKRLIFADCEKWEEWEDITAEEEESAVLSIMPCLVELKILSCKGLTALPHRLLRKAPLLETMDIGSSEQLIQQCNDINPSIRLILHPVRL